jgi:hypothetical protein
MKYLWIALLVASPLVADLRPETIREFAAYQSTVDQELAKRERGQMPFLWLDEHPDQKREVRQGEVVTSAITGPDGRSVSYGLIHDWVGDMYLRGVTLDAVSRFLLDAGHHAGVYPEVNESKILSREANGSVTKLRLVKRKVLTIVLDIEYRNRWQTPSPGRWIMSARSSKVQEVDDGTAQDPDTGQGFLWRMNSQWSLREDADGVWVELRSVSLSRDTPRGLGWMIRPMIRSFPAESIVSTMKATQAALESQKASAE